MNKKFFILLYLVIMVSFTGPQSAEAQVSSDAIRALLAANIRVLGQRPDAINFSLPMLNGETRTLSSYKGKVVILNFWATWCPPCRAEMPSMEILYNRLQNQGLEILAVDIGETSSAVQQFLRSNNYTFPVFLDQSGRTGSLYGVEAIPTSFIIDRSGKIISRIVGSIQWDSQRVISGFEALLKSN
ncbi:MAG: TlpA family protein disulfide reductase [Treponema sp.]|nr:TlpA family protein disulfide reductase [Treponema sp.]